MPGLRGGRFCSLPGAASVKANYVEFHLPGQPRTRKEPRISTRGGKVRSYPDPQTAIDHAAWLKVWFKASAGLKLEGPVVVEVYVRLYRPKSHHKADGVSLTPDGRKHRYPPGFDLDNIAKCLLDALKHQAIEDDTQVVALHVTKRYVERSGPWLEGTHVSIRQVQEAG